MKNTLFAIPVLHEEVHVTVEVRVALNFQETALRGIRRVECERHFRRLQAYDSMILNGSA